MSRTSRWTIVAVMAVVGAMILPAGMAAAKKGKPAESSAVEVVIDRVGDGLATTCGGPLTMTPGGNMLRTDWVPTAQAIEAHLSIPWSRSFPDADGASAFTGCHGGLVDGSAGGFGGYLILSAGRDGSVELASRLDYYWEYGTKGRRTVQTVLELFEIGATLTRVDRQPFDWSAGGSPQTVTGEMELRRFQKLADGTGDGWVSFGSVLVEMMITIRPIDG